MALIQSFPSLFPDLPTRTTVIEQGIDVDLAQPIKQHDSRVSPMKREVLRKEVEYLLSNDLAESSYNSWSSPCVLV